MPPENRETMQKGLKASLGCFQAKSLLYGPSYPRSISGQALELKYNTDAKQASVKSESDGALKSDKLAIRSECCGRSVGQENYYVWPALSPNFAKDAHSPSYPLDGCIYPTNHGSYIRTHWLPQVPIQMVPQSYSTDYMFQDFQYFVVIDFEATCDKERNPHPQEIIEFPSVIVNTRTGLLEDYFQIYVRPTHNKTLTEFCKELTGIQQSQVDKGVLLSEALLMHDKWLEDKGIKQANFAVVTWSNWDCRVMLESECRFKRIRKPPYFNRWINLKIPFNKLFGYARRNLKEAVELAGLTWEGRAHCGLDDAKNTARLLTHLMNRGFKFSITNSIQWQSADYPTSYYHIPASSETNLAYYPTHKFKTSPFVTFIPLQATNNPLKDPPVYCLCGALSFKQVWPHPGPRQGCLFFGCGNWTANGVHCGFHQWAVGGSDMAKTV